ncbi:MAG: tRNA (guanine(10)-N(2))-dimethyltransferase [Candidatus Nezhaarchaeota archaeon]|nr:tRNA (guanine(10)-N(2))-dimethyltransferase [Candidatus Nezhaarchaeota archaeon]
MGSLKGAMKVEKLKEGRHTETRQRWVKVPLKILQEGKVTVLLPDEKVLGSEAAKKVLFYNAFTAFSRDFSLCFLKTYARLKGRPIRVAEPLTASGVRGLRYAKEVDEVREVVISDINPVAVDFARMSVALNGLQCKVRVELSDANEFLSAHGVKGGRFDVVDVDPFGSPAPYVDSAIRSTLIGGVIAVTATDMPPLCGVYPEVALRRYGGLSLRTEYCHEIAVRLLLYLLYREASKYNLSIKPLTAHSTRHYVRVYVQLLSTKSVGGVGFLYHCFKCLHREVVDISDVGLRSTLCENCGGAMKLAGPLWTGAIFDKRFCEELCATLSMMDYLSSKSSLKKLLSLIVAEADGPPTYYTLSSLSRVYRIREPKTQKLIERLRSQGFYASPTHFNFKGLRFNGRISELLNFLMS